MRDWLPGTYSMLNNTIGLDMDTFASDQPARRDRGRSVRRGVTVVAAGAAVVLGVGVAYAAWTSNASGNAAAKAGAINFAVNATTTNLTTTPPPNLPYPGSVAGSVAANAVGGDLIVHIANTSGFAIRVLAVQQYGLVTTSGGGCTNDTGSAGSAGNATTAAAAPTVTNSATNSGLQVGTAATAYKFTLGTPMTIAGGADADVIIPNALSMSTTSLSACQGATFTIPVQVQAST